MKDNLTIGTRGSKLALYQANLVKEELLKCFKNLDVSISIIKTKGDQLLEKSLSSLLDKGFFTKEIQDKLYAGNIDLAVHSLKDLPTDLPKESCIAAILKREDHRDVFISRNSKPLSEFSSSDIIGTSSLRRKSQLLKYNSSLNVKEIRGNVDTRIKKMLNGDYQAIVMAAAGVKRLGLQKHITEYFDTDFMLTAPGQGAIAVEVRSNDSKTKEIVSKLNDELTQVCVNSERDFLRKLGGGCHVPFAAHSKISGSSITIDALVNSIDGRKSFREKKTVDLMQVKILGENIAENILSSGASIIVDELKTSKL
jgi:hydroxymethylbilane synthase